MDVSRLSETERAELYKLLLMREGQNHLAEFVKHTKPDYQFSLHHRMLIDKLEAVERGDITRLMIFMPPRHGKSQLASTRFPVWFLGRNPTSTVILASYNSDKASDFGHEIRQIVRDDSCRNIFPTLNLSPDRKAANRWTTTDGGEFYSAGVKTAITGRGADLLIIDDPHKGREEAESATVRESIFEWYRSDCYTRLMPDARVILIQTRWHEDDLAGSILAHSEGWEVLSLPALAEQDDLLGRQVGEALWPEWFDEDSLGEIKRSIGSRQFAALYQQRPSPEDGAIFKREWFKRHDRVEVPLNYYMTADFAATQGGGDFTEIGIWGLDAESNIYQIDWWHGQVSPTAWAEIIFRFWKKYRPYRLFFEPGQIRRVIESILKEERRRRKIAIAWTVIPHMGSKQVRSRAFEALSEDGRVSLLNGPKGSRVLDQLLKFPSGKYDDAVDACSLIGLAIDSAHGKKMATNQKPIKPRDYGAAMFEENNWKLV